MIESGEHSSEETLRFVEICAAAMRLKAIAEKLEMPAACGAAQRVIEDADKIGPNAAYLSADHLTGLVGQMSSLVSCFHDELQARLLFVIEPGQARYYSDETPLFGEKVNDAFPSASQEIGDAGKCRALGRWTACVIHLMRALEPGLNALAKYVGVAPDQNWNTALNEIDAKLKEIKKSTSGPRTSNGRRKRPRIFG